MLHRVDRDYRAAAFLSWAFRWNHGIGRAVCVEAGAAAGRYRTCGERLLLPLSVRARVSILRREMRPGYGGRDSHQHFGPRCRADRRADPGLRRIYYAAEGILQNRLRYCPEIWRDFY